MTTPRSVLLDENMPRGMAEGLTAAGHDVLSVATAGSGIDDRAVLALARREGTRRRPFAPAVTDGGV